MEHIWCLAVAIFLISIGAVLLLFAYVFQGSSVAVAALWVSFGLILFGIVKGIFTIIDHHDQMKEKTEE